jgi:hypothetical protein
MEKFIAKKPKMMIYSENTYKPCKRRNQNERERVRAKSRKKNGKERADFFLLFPLL